MQTLQEKNGSSFNACTIYSSMQFEISVNGKDNNKEINTGIHNKDGTEIITQGTETSGFAYSCRVV